jgi:hypothetical protein
MHAEKEQFVCSLILHFIPVVAYFNLLSIILFHSHYTQMHLNTYGWQRLRVSSLFLLWLLALHVA